MKTAFQLSCFCTVVLGSLWFGSAAGAAQATQPAGIEACRKAAAIQKLRDLDSEMKKLSVFEREIITNTQSPIAVCRRESGRGGLAERNRQCKTSLKPILQKQETFLSRTRELRSVANSYANAMATLKYPDCKFALEHLFAESWGLDQATAVTAFRQTCQCK